MAYIIDHADCELSEFDVDTATGTTSVKGPLNLTGLTIGTVVLDSFYDATIPGWRLLILNPE